MKLRWLLTCNEDGLKGEPELQYWSVDASRWCTVGLVQCKRWEVEQYLVNADADGSW